MNVSKKNLDRKKIRKGFVNMAYSFQFKVAALCYHIYKNTTWEEAIIVSRILIELETDERYKKIDPYCCSVKAIVSLSQQMKTMGHIPKEISRYLYFSLKEGNGATNKTVHSAVYRPSPNPAGGIEIPVILN